MLLIRHGAKVSSKDGHGVTPLGVAAEHGNTEALDIFIKQGETVKHRLMLHTISCVYDDSLSCILPLLH